MVRGLILVLLVLFAAFSVRAGISFDLAGSDSGYAAGFHLMYSIRGDRPDEMFFSGRPVGVSFGRDSERFRFAVTSEIAGADDAVELVIYPAGRPKSSVRKRFVAPAASGTWRLEESVAWSELGVKPKEGTGLRLNVIRKFGGAEPETLALACGRGGEFADFAAVTLRDDAPSFDYGPVERLPEGKTHLVFDVVPAMDGKHKADTIIVGNLPTGTVMLDQRDLRKGVRAHYEVNGLARPSGDIILKLTDARGRLAFNAQIPYRYANPVQYRCLHVDPVKDLLELETDNWVDDGDDVRIRIEMRDWDRDSTTVYAETRPAAKGHGFVRQGFDIRRLPPGIYNLHYAFIGKDGKVFEEDRVYFGKPGEPGGAWADTPAGLEDTVPAPWTKPEWHDAGFGCWGREMKFGGDGLVSRIVTAGKDLLARPVAVVLNGERLEFDVRSVHQGVASADWVLTARRGDVRVELHAEFDGSMWFKASYGADRRPVRSLAVEIPLRRERVSAFDDCSSVYDKLSLANGRSGEWPVSPLERPFFWMGDMSCGLMGGGDSIRGWHLKDRAHGYVLRSGAKEAVLTMNVVDDPFVPEAERSFEFYLMATPTKPKSRVLVTWPRAKIQAWTGHVSRFFETKQEGLMLEESCERFRKQQESGRRVFYYNGSYGASPVSPWWGWFGNRWTIWNTPSRFTDTINPKRSVRENGRYVFCCFNERNFLENKIWGLDWFLNEPRYKVMDLYFDLANPRRCENPSHGCIWTDDFGRLATNWTQRATREYHLRVRRILKAKNPDGAMMGHLTYSRTPSDVFFDILTMGEVYERKVRLQHDYYGILDPEAMRIQYGSRLNESVIHLIPQIWRTIYAYMPQLKKDHDTERPETDRATRHALAYFRIHGATTSPMCADRRDGDGLQWGVVERYLESMGMERTFTSYFTDDCPIVCSDRDDRFLYALYAGKGRALAIFLNDTESARTFEVGVDPKSLPGRRGRELFGRGDYDAASGRLTIALPPRESLFIAFEEEK